MKKSLYYLIFITVLHFVTLSPVLAKSSFSGGFSKKSTSSSSQSKSSSSKSFSAGFGKKSTSQTKTLPESNSALNQQLSKQTSQQKALETYDNRTTVSKIPELPSNITYQPQPNYHPNSQPERTTTPSFQLPPLNYHRPIEPPVILNRSTPTQPYFLNPATVNSVKKSDNSHWILWSILGVAVIGGAGYLLYHRANKNNDSQPNYRL